MPDTPQRFGRYVLLEEIARGGMGVVHRARDTVVGRSVALKIMLDGDEEAVARFQREVRTAAQVVHPNIVRVHDIGVEEGRHYYTMDFVEGPSLAHVIRDMRMLPPRAAARIARDVARALDAAHARGVVHRDIKPSNILLAAESSASEDRPSHDTRVRLGGGFTDSYRVLLADFGLAKELDTTRKMTMTGAILGTPAYMSPEQAAGDDVDARTDVYSLSAVLYEMLAGRPPFESDNLHALITKVIHDDPPSLPPQLNPDVRTIVAKGMAKERGRRYASARELADDLDRFLAGEAIAARPASFWYRLRKKAARNKAWTTGLVAAALAVAAAAGYFLGPAWVETRGRRTLRWPAGRHQVECAEPGFDRQEAELVLPPWRTTPWNPPRIPDHGFVTVLTTPPGAEVEFVVDGRRAAAGRAGERTRVRKGTVELRIALADHEPFSEAVHVPEGGDIVLERSLIHETGFLSVSASDPGASVTVVAEDRRVLGTWSLPVSRLEVPTGRYRLQFRALNRFPRESGISIRRSPKGARVDPESLKVNLHFEPLDLRSLLAIWGRITGVEFELEGEDRMVEELDLRDMPFSDALETLVRKTGLTLVSIRHAPDGTPVYRLGPGRGGGVSFVPNPCVAYARASLVPIEKWSFKTEGAVVARTALADLDGDGALDLLIASQDAKLYALSGRDAKKLWEFKAAAGFTSSPASADLNADGTPDCVAASFDGKVFALSGRDGRKMWEYQTGKSIVSSPALGDLDGDGIPDCVIGSNDNHVYALSGREGRLLWKFATGHTVQGFPVIADLDADGSPECVVGSSDRNVYALSGRDGKKVWEFPTGGVVISKPALADLDGDRCLDCVVGSLDGSVYAISGRDGSRLWERELGGRLGSSPALGDVDGDGALDCVMGSADGRVWCLSARNGGVLWEFRTGGSIQGSATLGDLDGDGVLDIVVPSSDSKVYALSGLPGRETRVLWEFVTEGRIVAPPALADLDGDGETECVVGSFDSRIYVLSVGVPVERWRWQAGAGFQSSPRWGDLNGDGVADSVVGSNDSCVYAHSGRDGLRLWTFKTGGMVVSPAALGDLDGDGVLDCVVGSLDRWIYALSGTDGRRLWEYEMEGGAWAAPVLGDLNGDGRTECVMACMDSTVYVLEGSSGRLLWETRAGDSLMSTPALADLNRDGFVDVVVGSSDHHLHAFSGRDGAPLWSYETGYIIQSSPALSDLDGDGVVDAVVGSGDRKLHAVSGRDGRRIWEFQAAGSIVSTAALADLNSDGIADAIVGSWDGRVHALSGRDGSRLWDFRATGPVKSSAALADLNGDGVPDAVIGADTKVYGISGLDGAWLWEFRTGGEVQATPAVLDLDGDGRLECGLVSGDALIYCLSLRPRPVPMARRAQLYVRNETWRAIANLPRPREPLDPRADIAVGIAMMRLGRNDEARSALERAAEAMPNNVTCRVILASRERLEEALRADPLWTFDQTHRLGMRAPLQSAAQAVLDALPQDSLARAVALLFAGRFAEARTALTALMADGRSPHLLKVRGRAAYDAGDPKAALEDWEASPPFPERETWIEAARRKIRSP